MGRVRLPDGAVPFAWGRDADVYALDGGRVLRRYRSGGDVVGEAELMRYVERYGFPVPAVHDAEGTDLVMDRLDGPTMLAAVAEGNITPKDAGRLLAELHDRLHTLPAPSGTPALTVIHRDLHPDNVMMTADGPVVIDWRNATEGSAAFDVALSAVIMGQVALDPDQPELAEAAREGLEAFAAATDPRTMLDDAIAWRADDPNLTAAEIERLPAVAELINRAW